jgi:Phage protein (N4 Gp49/phage Sf6 gene 66) family
MDDGIALISASHPVAPWYRRLWSWLFLRPRLSEGSLEDIEIEIRYMPIKLEPGDLEACDAAMRLEKAQEDYAMATADDIEQETPAKPEGAPRVTLAHVEGRIAGEYFFTAADGVHGNDLGPNFEQHFTPLSCLTFCVLVLKNGFTVTGESACVSLENFDAETGRKIARQKAVDKICMLEGYLLKQELFEESKEYPAANTTTKPDDPLGQPKTV